ncbi:chaperone NapD [Endothiovibrio diazotrophicus]
MNICSVVVHARLAAAEGVRARLLAFPGVEVHGESAGRLVVTVEHAERAVVSEALMEFHNIDGVLSSALIYEFCDDAEAADAPPHATRESIPQEVSP